MNVIFVGYDKDVQLGKIVEFVQLDRPFAEPSKKNPTDSEYLEWLDGFKAANSAYQDYCTKILRTNKGSASQFGQDLFVFHNRFRDWPLLNRTGFYVDSGANDAESISNTFFFDVCLGWKGLCVEPQPEYHAGIRSKRSCKLIPKCISNEEHRLAMTNEGAGSRVIGGDGASECSTLLSMLQSSEDWDPERGVSLWSLDIEGYELTVLDSVDFASIKMDTILIEDHCHVRELSRKLDESGFVKFHQLPIDAVFVPRGFEMPEKIWYNEDYLLYWTLNNNWRRETGQMAC